MSYRRRLVIGGQIHDLGFVAVAVTAEHVSQAAGISPATQALIDRCFTALRPREPMTVAQWAERFRIMPPTDPIPGPWRYAITPYWREVCEAWTDQDTRLIVCQKPAQVGWTQGVISNVLGYVADRDPSPALVMFPREKTAKDFVREKFDPLIQWSPPLAHLATGSKRTSAKQTQLFREFPGGFFKFVGSQTMSDLQSTTARFALVEEPDSCSRNIGGKGGDSLELLRDRLTAFDDSKQILGGTPTIRGASTIEEEMAQTDQRRWMVPCHDCDHAEPLAWGQVKWVQDDARHDPEFGTHVPESARYACPGCGVLWSDEQKNANVRRGWWQASAPFRGAAGFYVNSLMSPFNSVSMPRLVEQFLRAKHAMDAGDVAPMIAFSNSRLGESWEYRGDAPETDQLLARRGHYSLGLVPAGGLVLTAGVDVQHDRLHLLIYAWGRGERSWLVWREEIHGTPLQPAVWRELAERLARSWPHQSGGQLNIKCASVDSSDGSTADAVYSFVRQHSSQCLAIKGSSQDRSEIYAAPSRSVDVDRRGKWARYGLRPYIVGVSKAKDLLHARLRLDGLGPGVMHWPQDCPPEYFDQLTSEVRVATGRTGQRRWVLKAGLRNEDLDCTAYALHSARHLRLHTLSESGWHSIEQQLAQIDLLSAAVDSQQRAMHPEHANHATRSGSESETGHTKQQAPAGADSPGKHQRQNKHPGNDSRPSNRGRQRGKFSRRSLL